MALDALQCGFCTPGFVVSERVPPSWRAALVATPSRQEIAAALGHLCRCLAHDNIFARSPRRCSGRHYGVMEVGPGRGRQKVTGAIQHGRCASMQGQLEGPASRLLHAHARVKAVDLAGGALCQAWPWPFPCSTITAWCSSSAIRSPWSPWWIAMVLAVLAAIKVDDQTLPSAIGWTPRARPTCRSCFLAARGRRQCRRRRGHAGVMVRQCPWTPPRRSLKKKSARNCIAKARAEGDPLLFEGTLDSVVQQDALSGAPCLGRPI